MARIHRRQFLRSSAAAGMGFWLAGTMYGQESTPAKSDKLRIAIVGAGGQGAGNYRNVKSENVVAICDVDLARAAGTIKDAPGAAVYQDFRRMFDKEAKNLDAVVVSTPDHTHFHPSLLAIRMGKHVYCEKPLTHSIWEARTLREEAAKAGVITSMGNQGTSRDGLRTAVEVVQSGAIGDVTEVHVWTNRPGNYWKQGYATPKDRPVCPPEADWDLWLGPAPARPFHSLYHPFAWRGWCEFGTGALGDMACHTANMPFMALKLEHPTKVSAQTAPFNGDSYPIWSIITFEFPARGKLPPVKLVWYDGMKDGKRNLPPESVTEGKALADSGSFLIGSKGKLFSPDDYGESFKLLPEKDFEGYQPPKPTLARSPGHHKEWLNGIRAKKPPMASFDYAGRLTEFVLVGNLAVRLGKEIEWDGYAMKAKNVPEAEALIRRKYREGWSL